MHEWFFSQTFRLPAICKTFSVLINFQNKDCFKMGCGDCLKTNEKFDQLQTLPVTSLGIHTYIHYLTIHYDEGLGGGKRIATVVRLYFFCLKDTEK